MTGSRAIFWELDKAVHATVKLDEVSMVAIEGRGDLFQCKGGGHHALVGFWLASLLLLNQERPLCSDAP